MRLYKRKQIKNYQEKINIGERDKGNKQKQHLFINIAIKQLE